ncbi:MAG: IPT/TIG domain-containing protein [Patescibacteria group bacterium]
MAFTLLTGAGVFQVSHVYAQTESLETVGETAGLSAEDPKVIIGRIIRTGLGVLGIIATLIVLYGGWRYMTAGGDADKVDKAKKILINGGIGLVIILASYAITSFVISSLLNASDGGGGGGGGGGDGGGGLGGGNVATFTVTSIRPSGEVSIRNIKVTATLSRTLSATLPADAILIANESGDLVEGTIVAEGNSLTFTPIEFCPTPNDDLFCFEENTTYTVTISSDLESSTGTSITCGTNCSGTFTSGSLVDTEDPFVSITYPDDGARIPYSLGASMIQAEATDDSEISTISFYENDSLYDVVPASGLDLSDVLLSMNWEWSSSLAENATVALKAIATDLAGNTDSDRISVRLNPAHCYNDVLDADSGETSVDCGGDCGTCDGDACTANLDCASGVCIEGFCVVPPVITSFTPTDAGFGSFVTITGTGFGRSGTVSFTGADGSLLTAQIASCSDGWSSEELVVVVPEGVSDGPLTLVVGGLTEKTDDENGPLLADFTIDSEPTVSLCRLSPSSGYAGSTLTITGQNFGTQIDTSSVLFDGVTPATIKSWKADSIQVTVPSLAGKSYAVTVVNANLSNALSFDLKAASSWESTEAMPVMSAITPTSGGKNQYLTISGSNFGSSIGVVWFENPTSGYTAMGSADFPEACSTTFWSDDEITIMVPESYINDESIAISEHTVFVARQDGKESNSIDFTITTANPTPGICGIVPEEGAPGTSVVIYGDGFGAGEGDIRFYNEARANFSSWNDSEIVTATPAAAKSGPVTVIDENSVKSNGANFLITGSSDLDPVIPFIPKYSWIFSTGNIPLAPEPIFACSETQISGVPNKDFSSNICLNASLYVEFTMPMSTITTDGFVVEACETSTCKNTTVVEGMINQVSSTSVYFYPDELLPSTTYRVTLTTDSQSTDGVPLGNDVSWTFTTGTSGTQCLVEKMYVSPETITVNAIGSTGQFNGVPATADCVPLDSPSYLYTWTINESYASKGSCSPSASSCMKATALAEGTAAVTVKESASGVSGAGSFVIDFTDPEVTAYWPNCTEACVNSAIGARFNTSMDNSLEDAGMVTLSKCENELCANLDAGDLVSAGVVCVAGADGTPCVEMALSPLTTLAANTYYKVMISGEIASLSGVTLTKTNDGEDFSWIFATKNDGTLCSIDRASVEPAEALLNAVGERQSFSVSAYGEPDECSVAGQELVASDYAWVWENPIINDLDVAAWKTVGGALFDADASSVSGCTSSCMASGSDSYDAVCANGALEVGEECEDGNLTEGDGCSAHCLREGKGGGGSCGDGTLNRSASGAGEDCDDGNTKSGDGCSSTCLNEGANAVAGTCGNTSIAYAENQGGEDCDDGNKKSGDGCSSNCVNEGSRSYAELFAVCGDGAVTVPYESCDDGNGLNEDGCSSSCVREGTIVGMTCGNGAVERLSSNAGEDCDDGNTVDGDGCSSQCTFEGSSSSYVTPSVCGDGHAGIGEDFNCELLASGDGNIDPIQDAEIMNTAVDLVDTETQRATATIRVKELTSSVGSASTLSLSCVAETAEDCPSASLYGVSENGCCLPRPTATLMPNSNDVCLNASVYAIFSQEMDLASFTDRVYLQLDTTVIGTCPTSSGYEVYTPSTTTASSFIQKVFSFVVSSMFAQSTGPCILPIVSSSQEALTDGSYKVTFRVEHPLYPETQHMLVIFGDQTSRDLSLLVGGLSLSGSTDSTSEWLGVVDSHGIGLYLTTVQTFTTTDSMCRLDEVIITDSADAPGMFTSANESHDFSADAYSYQTGSRQEIASLPGVYAWKWDPWQSSDSTIAVIDSSSEDTAVISSLETSGSSTIIASAAVTEDAVGTDETDALTRSDDYQVEVSICNMPWPDYANYPFIDDATGTVDGTKKGIAWMNFSTHYCRDAGLPSVSVIAPPETKSENVIKEYLLKVDDGSGDAIGLRIASNEDYLPPELWYRAQGFAGSPSNENVDGFEAVRDGRTVYISAPNYVAALSADKRKSTVSALYPNIYILSYNEGASDDTIEIFNQIVANLSLMTNVSSAGFCTIVNNKWTIGGAYTTTTCSSDFDCGVGETCGDVRSKIQRDAARLTDLRTIENALAVYGASNGTCSATTSQRCTKSSDCPTDESCTPSYPQLESGTYVRSLVVSSWSSWNEAFGKTLGTTLPLDPINEAPACGVADSSFESYEADTCVNTTTGAYLCPLNSYAYHYRSLGPNDFDLTAELEYRLADWVYDIDTSTTYDLIVGGNTSTKVEGFTGGTAYCDSSTVYGSSSSCGDGIVGSGETCELGEVGPLVSCTDSAGFSGTSTQVCNATCKGWTLPTGATCTAYSCGNGLVESGEICDDGSLNGTYGFCGYDCTYGSGFSCGDGSLASGEFCDCGSATSSGRTYGGGLCTTYGVLNGSYQTNPANSCSWDCTGPASYCGDGAVDSGEECDGNVETYSGLLCRQGITNIGRTQSSNVGKTCLQDSDCGTLGRCGGVGSEPVYDACPNTTVCLLGDVNLLGSACTVDSDCDSVEGDDGVCSDDAFQTTRTRTCADDGASGDACTWESQWMDLGCKAEVLCGNGVVDSGEACDDGNDSNTDDCTVQCTNNYCGDGYLYESVEECDEGSLNGVSCSSAYEAGCSYCSESCLSVAESGTFCGDGVRNGGEYCDAGDMPYLYVNNDGSFNGTCESSEKGESTSDGTSTYYCANVGVCDGGSEQGDVCIAFSTVAIDSLSVVLSDLSSCPGGTCVYPSCSPTCESSCPFTNESTSILMTTNTDRTNPVEEISLETYGMLSVDRDAGTIIPTAGTLMMPACSSANSLRAKVSFEDFTRPQNYLVFVTDLSASMATTFESGETRLEVTEESILTAGKSLFNALGEMIRVSTVGYQGGNVYLPGDVISGYSAGDGFISSEAYDDLATVIASYSPGGGTNTFGGLEAAKNLLDGISDENTRKMVVLMTDGDYTEIYGDPMYMACVLKDDGIELFTATLASGTQSTLSSDGNECEKYKNSDGTYMSYEDYLSIADTRVSMFATLSLRIHHFFHSFISTVLARGMGTLGCDSSVIPFVINKMACYSSGNPNPDTGIDYAYNGSTKEELQTMYEEILQSILGVSLGFVVNGSMVTGAIQEGTSVELPWPTGFACTGEEQELPIRLFFEGEGTVDISDVSLNYCD